METSSVDPDVLTTARRAATVIYAVVVAMSLAIMFIWGAYLIPTFGPVVGSAGTFAVWVAALWGLHRLTGWLLDVACRFSEWMMRRHAARAGHDTDDA